MKNSIKLMLLCLLLSQSRLKAQEVTSNLQYVDPTIGAVGHILEPTRPTMHLPNSMVRVYPVRKDQLDDQISYFPLNMYSHRIGNVFALMPYNGVVNEKSWKQRFTYDLEKTAPHYYTAVLEESGIKVEFSPSERSGYYRFKFPSASANWLRLGVVNETGELKVSGKRILSGSEDFQGMKAYFYGELNADVTESKYKDGTGNKNLFLKVGNSHGVEFRYGISYISVEQAKINLEKEIPNWGFEKVKSTAKQVWEEALNQITVEGGTLAYKRSFYTALYRTYERMVNINEYGRYYSAYDHKVHSDSRPFYVDNWIWDSYLAHQPLHMILNPDRQADMISSYVNMYEQSGWMPSFALVFGDNPCMTGNHAAAWITDAWFKGIRNFNVEKAYAGLKKNSLEATLLPWRNGPAIGLDSFYAEKGYFPALRPGEKESVNEVHDFEKRQSVAVTLQQSYDDWCISKLAGTLGKAADSKLFLAKAENYKNVFRESKGFMWPKDDKGQWIEPFDPKFSGGQGGREYFTENNAYTYNWDVKHDLEGLFKLMGGKQAAENKLDNLFREDLGRSKYVLWNTFPDATGLVGQFVMGNEPSFHIPYLYNDLGSPWKTQKRIRMLMDTWFTDNLFSIPGDEDGGGMSAFVVFSMMGFYPVTPGIPVYHIGSPVFNKISLKLKNGKTFTVVARNNSSTAKYIQSAKLNGVNWDKHSFNHADILKGGNLELVMGETPNKQWGKTK
ncbi:GH92 family glycosyl hydrolase [Pedobacter heparinus]|uniref:Alpha-1,2-mannosidase n=1 Tax=Pedobacter heparinus (strain ATCC 13125 / DSM 2366 / CIP 104194 / JCM 7457 / NBRC 12017 / NCIMB 9290 / NRRL B-14731 / HIM 762-3) TaxID=485917 RepID=C6XSJ0_PEDHD|nr:GH92 family glycosyl hydrolase [Pedobacter heparinus]ACU05553.1 alpha-1,2-mannosidase [Pedobacter heparinus DSM 2366]